ncbi:hypothetical protein D3C73_1457780 [compost metagenome]
MSHNDNFIGSKLINSDEYTTHNTTKRLGDDRACIFDNFHIAIFQIHGLRQHFNQPGIHTGDDYHFFGWEFASRILFVFFCLDKCFVVFQYLLNVVHIHCLL